MIPIPRLARTAAALGVLLTLAACAGTPPKPSRPPLSQQEIDARQRLTAAETQCRQIASDPQLTPLRGRLMAYDQSQPWTREMMIDQRKVTETDRQLLLLMDEKRAPCRQAMLAASPAQTVPLLDYWQRQDAALVKVYNRQSTIGDYNRTMADAHAQFSIDVTNLQADTAARANRAVVDAPPTAPRTAGETLPAERFRAFQPR